MSVCRVNKRNKLRTAQNPKVLKLFSETLLGKSYPENVDKLMIEPRDYEV